MKMLLHNMEGVPKLVASLLYGSGLRRNEAVRLRLAAKEFRLLEPRHLRAALTGIVPGPKEKQVLKDMMTEGDPTNKIFL